MRIPLDKSTQYDHLDPRSRYSRGGFSFLSGEVNGRGEYIDVTPVKI